MARGESFLELQVMLREELGRSTDVSVGVDDLPGLKRQINKAYANLYISTDWPFLRRVFPRITLSAGQRYYDLPTDLNVERIEIVNAWWNGLPTPVERSIEFENYASYDSEADERSDPVISWDIRDDAGTAQIEVWPIPASNAQTLQIIGIRSAPKLVNNEDLCLLDDELVVLHAAAGQLRRQKSADADDTAAQAARRLQLLTGRSSGGGAKSYRMGVGDDMETAMARGRAVVRISGS